MQLLLPLDITDVCVFLGISELLLLIASLVSSKSHEPSDFVISPRRIDYAAIVNGILFLVTVIIRIL